MGEPPNFLSEQWARPARLKCVQPCQASYMHPPPQHCPLSRRLDTHRPTTRAHDAFPSSLLITSC
ncbi:hypothetical protein VDGL01_11858 [Verticillium dahliae]